MNPPWWVNILGVVVLFGFMAFCAWLGRRKAEKENEAERIAAVARRAANNQRLSEFEDKAFETAVKIEQWRREFIAGLPQYGNHEIQRLLREKETPDGDALIREALARLMQ